MKLSSLIFLALILPQFSCGEYELEDEVTPSAPKESVENFLNRANQELLRAAIPSVEATWHNAINNTKDSKHVMEIILSLEAKAIRNLTEQSRKYSSFQMEFGPLRRQLIMFEDQQTVTLLPDISYVQYLRKLDEMKSNFDKVRVCDYNNRTICNIKIEPQITDVFANVRNSNVLEYYWENFYDNFRRVERAPFKSYIRLTTDAAKLNKRTSGADYLFLKYEDPAVESTIEAIINEMKPLYLQLHAYVRYRLKKYYGKIVSTTGPIEMHLLGNLWGENWSNIFSIVAPYPNAEMFDIRKKMIEKKLKVTDLYQQADDFFISLGLKKLPSSFWRNSIIQIPTEDKSDMNCYPEAFDFLLEDDVRLKFCTRLNRDHFRRVFNELGHLQYFLQYRGKPFLLRRPASPGFYEAIGDAIGLSAMSPRHLEHMDLLKDYVENKTSRINYLFLIALEKLVFIPFAYSMEKYRSSVFRQHFKKGYWNCAYWKLREDHCGIEPPFVRSRQNFDPVADYRIAAGKDYFSLAFGTILQFQLFEAACFKSGEYVANSSIKTLDNCDFFGNKDVGKLFKDMLSNGAQELWTDVLLNFTGIGILSAQPMLNYFAPLYNWLQEENKRLNVLVGWTSSDKCVRMSNARTTVAFKSLTILFSFGLIFVFKVF